MKSCTESQDGSRDKILPEQAKPKEIIMPPKTLSVHTNQETVDDLTNIARMNKISRNKLIHNLLECFVDVFKFNHDSMRKQLDKAYKIISKQKDELTTLRLQNAKLLIDKRNRQRNGKI